MATAKTTAAEITEIQRQMAQVRHELHQEAREMVKGAESLTDWRSHVRHHPWLALGAAAAVGYLIVPRRRQEPAPTIVAVAPQPAGAMVPARAAAEPKKKRWGLIGSAVGLLAPIAVRAAQTTPSSTSSSGSRRSRPGAWRRSSAPGRCRGPRRRAARRSRAAAGAGTGRRPAPRCPLSRET